MEDLYNELIDFNGEGNRCNQCSKKSCKGECLAGVGKIFSKVQLIGKRSNYLKKTRLYELEGVNLVNIADRVWKWTEAMIKNGRGSYYLKESMRLMRENIGSDDWEESKQTILNLGPDNYQLGMDRELQPVIQQLWWRLCKYQFRLRGEKILHRETKTV